MKYIFSILLIILTITIASASNIFGRKIVSVANFEIFTSDDSVNGNWVVTKFIDPDNNNICYVAKAWGYGGTVGISCIK